MIIVVYLRRHFKNNLLLCKPIKQLPPDLNLAKISPTGSIANKNVAIISPGYVGVTHLCVLIADVRKFIRRKTVATSVATAKRHSLYLLVRCSKVPSFHSCFGSRLSTCLSTTSRESHPVSWRVNSRSHKRQRGLCCRKSESCYERHGLTRLWNG